MTEFIAHTENELTDAANYISKAIKNGDKIVFFTGDLGAGKTALIKRILNLHDIEERRVKSPTYVIKRQHKEFHHVDLYRLAEVDPDEIGLKGDEVYLIEWAEKLQGQIKPDLQVSIDINSDDSRTIRVEN